MQAKTRRFQALVSSGDVLYPGQPCRVSASVGGVAARDRVGCAASRNRADAARRRLHDAFRFIVAAGDTDRTKPAPDPYLRAAELHGFAAGGMRRHRRFAVGPACPRALLA